MQNQKNKEMEKNNFWNDAARYGALLGAVLSVSFILENWMTLSGRMTMYALMTVEWIAVVVLHYYLLHRFTRCRSLLYTAEEGFTFGQGYGYLMVVSAFAGIIVGVVQYVYLHLVLGYSNYTERMVEAVTDMLSMGGNVSASYEGMIVPMLEQIQSAPVPSVIATVWGGMFTSLLFGAVFGLIIAGVLARAPRPFDTLQSDN